MLCGMVFLKDLQMHARPLLLSYVSRLRCSNGVLQAHLYAMCRGDSTEGLMLVCTCRVSCQAFGSYPPPGRPASELLGVDGPACPLLLALDPLPLAVAWVDCARCCCVHSAALTALWQPLLQHRDGEARSRWCRAAPKPAAASVCCAVPLHAARHASMCACVWTI
jgi:hypothetical protein